MAYTDPSILQSILMMIFLGLIFLSIIYPDFQLRIALYQILQRVEPLLISIRNMRENSKNSLIKTIKKDSKANENEIREFVERRMEFYVIPPVSLDPFGIVKKIEHIINVADDYLKKSVKSIYNKKEYVNNISSAIFALSELYTLEKILVHYIEMARKTKNLQIAYTIMFLSHLFKKISNALYGGINSFIKELPIGDSIGPLVALKLIKENKGKIIRQKEFETILWKGKIENKNVYILKAEGPSSTVGKIGRAIEYTIKKYKIKNLITIDAAAKLEGEKTGTVAEGVGVAIGGIGIDSSFVEDIATKNKVWLESIVIKQGMEEALMPIRKEIADASDKVINIIKERIKNMNGNILIAGIGNTVGIGNEPKDFDETEKRLNEAFKEALRFLPKEPS